MGMEISHTSASAERQHPKRQSSQVGGLKLADTGRRFSFSNNNPKSGDNESLAAIDVGQYAVKVGYLFKRGGGKKSQGWKRRWFVLTGQHLLYYKSEREKKPQGIIQPLRDFTVETDVNDTKLKQFQFRIAPKKKDSRTYFIYSISQSDKEDWEEVLGHATTGGTQNKQSVEIEEKLRRNCYDIPAKDLEWKNNEADVLGKGASGIVKKGLWLKTTEVAIKALNNLPEFTDADETAQFYKEIETLSQLRHPNIVPMFGYCKKDGYVCLVTEFVKGGDLYSAIHDEHRNISTYLKIDLCSSICRGMVYLHNKHVTHRDLKPGNILVEYLEDAKVKVCDFGLSSITKNARDGDSELEVTYGTPGYAAPELSTETHTNKVDVFSFAVIMWEIYERKRPFADVPISSMILDMVDRGERPPLTEDNPLAALIASCWNHDPVKRPSFVEIYEELDRLKSTFTPTDYDNIPTFYKNQEMLKAEDKVLQAFNGNSSITWFELSTVLLEIFEPHIRSDGVEKLKYSIADGDIVTNVKWSEFIKWFTPLIRVDNYQTGGNEVSPMDGYQIEDVVDIVGANFFFGFMSAVEARDILMNKPIGAFLFRFSSNPGCYALSVNYGQIGHWRITTEKTSVSYPQFKIDGRSYNSLHEVVEKHIPGGDPLPIKVGGTTKNCYLKFPVDRNELNSQAKGHYESFD